MSTCELEKKLDQEINKRKCDRFVVEDICYEILSDENSSTSTIKKIYKYIDIGAIDTGWGSFPYKELHEHKKSPFNILISNTDYKDITDVLFISLNLDTEIYPLIVNHLQSNNCKSEREVKKILIDLKRDEKSIKYLSNELAKKMPFHLRFVPFSSQIRKDIVLENVRSMLRHLNCGYNLFSKIDELLIGFRPPGGLNYSEIYYWKIVQDIRRLCSKYKNKPNVLSALVEDRISVKISNLALAVQAGFFTRVFFQGTYRELWRQRATSVCCDIVQHINKDV